LSSEQDHEVHAVVHSPSAARPSLLPIILLSIMFGVSLTLTIGGAIYYNRLTKTLAINLTKAQADLKQKASLLSEAGEQIAELSKQMQSLKDAAVARSGTSAEKLNAASKKPEPTKETPSSATDSKADSATTADKPAHTATADTTTKSDTPTGKSDPAATEKKSDVQTSSRKTKRNTATAEVKSNASKLDAAKAKPPRSDCYVAGRSSSDQVSALQRCVEAMDGGGIPPKKGK
jgi:hypothetical protein